MTLFEFLVPTIALLFGLIMLCVFSYLDRKNKK